MVTNNKQIGPKINFKTERITLSHGSGGRSMMMLIQQLFNKAFDNPYLNQGDDFARLQLTGKPIAISTDGHVVSPLFYPGGDIGELAVNGTINDIAMSGATPRYLSVGFIIEEGLLLTELKTIVHSMAQAAKQANVYIVCGDTKVVEKGKGDGVFITTSGIGEIMTNVDISGSNAKVGDKIIINGYIGDHGIAILSQRENLEFSASIKSDSAPLHDLVATILAASDGVHCLRDPTRGGLATTLNELAQQSEVGMKIHEATIPLRDEVAGACELLGLDPLYVANEGKLVCICDPSQANTILTAMRSHPLGKDAAIIGEVVNDENNFVQLTTSFGGERIVDMLSGEQLPRIC